MKKVLLAIVLLGVLSCSSDDDKSCPNGKIKQKNNIQDRCFLVFDNGTEVDIDCDDFDKYPSNSCYEGIK